MRCSPGVTRPAASGLDRARLPRGAPSIHTNAPLGRLVRTRQGGLASTTAAAGGGVASVGSAVASRTAFPDGAATGSAAA
jgi:hypothetical protein